VSKKRNKNQRKKQVKGRSPRPKDSADSSSERGSTRLESKWDDAYQAPEVQTPTEGGGTIGRMKDMMSHSEEGEDASLLHKRRGCPELMLWFIGGSFVFWVVMRLLAAFAESEGL